MGGCFSTRASIKKGPIKPREYEGETVGTFDNAHGLKMFYRKWLVQNPDSRKGRVFISHGFGQHSGMYEWIANQLNQDGFDVFSVDHQGFGYSDGDRAYVERFQHYVDDFNQFVDIVIKANPDTKGPNFLLGHSLGGAIALLAAHEKPQQWSAVFLSAPAVVVDPKFAKPHLVAMASLISSCMPKLEVPGDKPPPSVCCRDADFATRFNEDTLIYKGFLKGRFGHESLQAFKKIQEIVVPSWTVPLMIGHGTDDKIVMISGSQFVYDKTVKCQDKKMMTYEGFYHELLQEPLEDRTRVYKDMSSWFSSHVV